jgi:hypothetical protein
MERLTEREPYWMGEEFWTSAREPDEEEIDAVYERLKHYEDMEEQGKILSIPCKPEDAVYVISDYSNNKTRFEIIKAVVTTVRLKNDGKTVSFSCRGKWKNQNPYIGNFVSNSIGKTVFLTEQEAKEELKRK